LSLCINHYFPWPRGEDYNAVGSRVWLSECARMLFQVEYGMIHVIAWYILLHDHDIKSFVISQGVLPKLVAHTFLVFLLLIHGQLILMLVNIPMTMWLFYEYFSVPSGNLGVYDPTEIHNRSQLKRYTRDSMIHLGYCLVFFFIYLYW